MSNSLGTLKVGKLADIIATDISPLKDMNALLSIGFVMKSGEVVKKFTEKKSMKKCRPIRSVFLYQDINIK